MFEKAMENLTKIKTVIRSLCPVNKSTTHYIQKRKYTKDKRSIDFLMKQELANFDVIIKVFFVNAFAKIPRCREH